MAKPVLTCWLNNWLEVAEVLKADGKSLIYRFCNKYVHCLNKEVFPEFLLGFLKSANLKQTAFGTLIQQQKGTDLLRLFLESNVELCGQQSIVKSECWEVFEDYWTKDV